MLSVHGVQYESKRRIYSSFAIFSGNINSENWKNKAVSVNKMIIIKEFD